VRIMKEAWGDRLVQGPLEGVDDEWITPKDLEGRIVVMVEYHPPPLIRRSGTSTSVTEEDSSKPKRKWSLWRSDDTSSSSDSSDEESSGEDIYDDEGGAKSLWPFGGKKKPTEEPTDGEAEIEKCPKISDDLAGLGYYARSMKPAKGWLSQSMSSPSPLGTSIISDFEPRVQRRSSHYDQHLRVSLLQASFCNRRTQA
jgi:phosphatidylinositol phospholipase C delta